MSFAIVFGTRPEIVKFISVIEELKRKSLDFEIIYTGQHYDYEMSDRFFEDFNIKPAIFLSVGPGSQSEQTGKILIKVEEQLLRAEPSLTLVEGDTNSALAGALASSKLQIPVGHVEAGCRSFDFYMPEETNRKLIDHCSELLFAPTVTTYENLEKEGLSNRAHIVGSTLTDVCTRMMRSFSLGDEKIRDSVGLTRGDCYALVTIHRRENIENRKNMTEIVMALLALPAKAVFPVHPHTLRRLKEFRLYRRLEGCKHIVLTPPLGYRPFLYLLEHARVAITDSGGIQEEASIVNTPCITARNNTEWPETVKIGKNILTGPVKTKILRTAKRIISDEDFYNYMKSRESPFKSGAGAKIVEISQNFMNGGKS